MPIHSLPMKSAWDQGHVLVGENIRIFSTSSSVTSVKEDDVCLVRGVGLGSGMGDKKQISTLFKDT